MKILRNILWIADFVLYFICGIIGGITGSILTLVFMLMNLQYFWIVAIVCAVLTLGLIIYDARDGEGIEINLIVLFIIYLVLTPVGLWLSNVIKGA